MSSDKSMIENALSGLLEKANSSHLTPLRLKDWSKVIEWRVDDQAYFWVSDGTHFLVSEPRQADFVLKLSAETLSRIVEGKLPLFIALWGTGEIQIEGVQLFGGVQFL